VGRRRSRVAGTPPGSRGPQRPTAGAPGSSLSSPPPSPPAGGDDPLDSGDQVQTLGQALGEIARRGFSADDGEPGAADDVDEVGRPIVTRAEREFQEEGRDLFVPVSVVVSLVGYAATFLLAMWDEGVDLDKLAGNP